MLNGYAWRVEYPRRSAQGFVSTNTEYVRKEIATDMRNLPNWRFRVSLIAFRGETALSITTSVNDILDDFPEGLAARLRYENGYLIYDGQ